MAKKLKVRIPDKKEDVFLETTQRGLGWMRRFQGPIYVGAAIIISVSVLVVYGVELERRSDVVAWEAYMDEGKGKPAAVYRGIAEKYPGTTVEPWARLDEAHALSRTGIEDDREAAMKIYRELADRYEEGSIVRRIAEQSLIGVQQESDFQVPQSPPEEPPSPEDPPSEPEPAPAEKGEPSSEENP